ncbi:MAG: hypothetical protein A3K66_05060 [Euryarchaeota archaeon RBG_16_67_27]|nr:MAG: hypothetical protein A3K66_05060 [Euryarchaeota archaeon RBG_16_67_27]
MARPPAAVVDASVAAKWFLQEPHSEAALSLRDAHVDGNVSLVAPSLVIVEVANALRYHPGIGSELLADHVTALLDLGLGLDPVSEESISAAVRCAYRVGLTVYDAWYISLAERMDCPLVTADQTQLRAAGARGVHVDRWPASE